MRIKDTDENINNGNKDNKFKISKIINIAMKKISK